MNINRDYLIILDVKSGEVDSPNIYYFNTDKNTSNLYVQMVLRETNIEANPIENATDYSIKANVIKPDLDFHILDGTLVNEEKAIYEFNLTEECINLSGKCKIEFEVFSKVNNIEESITSFSTKFKVFPSILTDTNKPTETSSDYPILKKLIEDIENLKNSGQISHGHDNKTILDSITSTKVNNWNKAYTHSQSSHFSGNYNDLTNKPTIPSNTSDLTNDSGFATETYVSNAIANAQLGSGGEVDLSGYVTKEIGNASQITFSDGQTFQEKLDTGILKGDRGEQGSKGDRGEQGPQGEKGEKGDTGNDGYTPVKGIDYFDGAKGDKGDPGENGQDGLTTQVSVNGTAYTHINGLITLPDYPTVPTKTSQLTNDSGYATETYVASKIAEASLSGGEVDLSGYATKDDIPTKTSQLTNDSGFITASDIPEGHTHTNKAVLDNISSTKVSNWDTAYTHSQSSHAPSNAQKNSDITKSEIETKLTGNITTHTHNQYLTEHQSLDGYAKTTDLATVATTGSYNDLIDKPTIPTAYTHPANHPASMITGLSTVATSGNYNDLINLPTIPSEYNLPIANQTTLGGIKVGAGLSITSDGILSATGGGTADSVNWENVVGRPTKLSQFTNDSGFITSIPSEYITETELTNMNYATKDELHSHTNKTVLDGITSAKVTTWDNKSDFSGSYNDLTDKPTIPTVTNDLTNALKSNYDSAYAHSQAAHAPTNAEANVQADWNVTDTGSDAYIKNKPTIPEAYTHPTTHPASMITGLANVATTGSYNDLSNKPTIPTIPSSLPANGGNADTVDNFHLWKGTQAQYDAITTKDSNTIYMITG